MTIMSASTMLALISVVAVKLGFSFTPGKYLGFSCNVLMDSAVLALRIHCTDLMSLSAMMLATTVPKLPPPITAGLLKLIYSLNFNGFGFKTLMNGLIRQIHFYSSG